MGNKKEITASSGGTAVKKGGKRINGTRLFLLIFAGLALISVVTAIVLALVNNARNKLVDYVNDDLSKYVSLSYGDYSSFDAHIIADPVTDEAIENKIIQLLYKHRKDSEDMKFKQGETIRVGDNANIYYYGYTLDKDGNKVAFTGGCNFGSEKSHSLGIGSGGFIQGFELGLIGKNQNDYATFKKSTETKVAAGNTVFITYTAINFDGTYEKDATALLDLSDKSTEEKWGEGFIEYLLDATVGTKISKEFKRTRTDANGKTGSDIICDVTVNSIIELGEGEPLTVETYFPVNYQSADLAGKTAYFDVYIMTTQLYDTPEFTDEFITEKLKYTPEELAEYEGATLTEKYRSKIRSELELRYSCAVDNSIEAGLWERLTAKAKIKRLPENEVFDFYNSYVTEIEGYYSYYSSSYASLDVAACDYLKLDKGSDWKAELRRMAEESISQKLMFYYLIQLEDIYPSAEAQKEKYDMLIEYYLLDYLEYYKVERSNYNSAEDYKKAIDNYRATVISSYGEEYFKENAVFLAALDELKQYANLIYAE